MLSKEERQTYQESALLAAEWLVKVAQKQEDQLTIEKNSHKLELTHWRGSIRGEYNVAKKEWDYFCPVWHTGQAIRALSLLYKITKENWILESAELGAEFLEKNSNQDSKSKNFGLILGYEDYGNLVNTSAILEAVDGLFQLAEITNDAHYRNLGIHAVEWVYKTQYIPGEGLCYDLFDPSNGTVKKNEKRPLNDNAMLLKTAKLTDNAPMRKAFYEICNRLLDEEEPPGNWIGYGPCNAKRGILHPRHAFWWGWPFINAYQETKELKYLKAAERAGEWYLKAVRRDGGLFRGTYTDFSTDSFGQATSGAACAVLIWNDLYSSTKDNRWAKAVKKSLEFCQKMQFTMPQDENLYGSILEKVLPPNGTDQNPYQIRDLGTIFYIQAVAEVILKNQ